MLINNAWRKRTDKSVNAAKCNLFARVYYEIRLKTMQIHSLGKYFFVRQELFFLVKYTKELILFVSKEITDSARGMFDRLINHSPSNGKWYAATEGEMQRTVVLKRNLLVWRNIFTIFPLLPLWMSDFHRCRRWGKKTPKYFFRSANPMVEKIFDSQTIGNFVAKYSSCYISQSETLKRTIVDRNYHTNVYISISLKKSNRNYTK